MYVHFRTNRDRSSGRDSRIRYETYIRIRVSYQIRLMMKRPFQPACIEWKIFKPSPRLTNQIPAVSLIQKQNHSECHGVQGLTLLIIDSEDFLHRLELPSTDCRGDIYMGDIRCITRCHLVNGDDDRCINIYIFAIPGLCQSLCSSTDRN